MNKNHGEPNCFTIFALGACVICGNIAIITPTMRPTIVINSNRSEEIIL